MVALRRPGEFRGEASVRTWLFRITNNIVRSRRRVRRWLFRLHGPSAEEAIAPVTPLESIERRESAARLHAALDDIPDIYRTAFILYELEGLPCEEVATLVGVDVGTVWVRLHRGRANLQSAEWLERAVDHAGECGFAPALTKTRRRGTTTARSAPRRVEIAHDRRMIRDQRAVASARLDHRRKQRARASPGEPVEPRRQALVPAP
jgi:RNA polymerase sigma-70 factor (ECF subfamily)